MAINEELRREIKDLIDNFPPYPDLDALIANGDIAKVRGGYNVLTEAGLEAIKDHTIGFSSGGKDKPAVFQLSRGKKSRNVREK
ncbi:hypothetical protein [Pseudomonas carnis]|uniref:hypothetical protein n=1 Tax=Pseudomonas carnis TaxID=2487355 RepID=UPI00196925E7|nr:hypothetical protein [Pseudomonas carnis]